MLAGFTEVAPNNYLADAVVIAEVPEQITFRFAARSSRGSCTR
jgi:hypothetical protein